VCLIRPAYSHLVSGLYIHATILLSQYPTPIILPRHIYPTRRTDCIDAYSCPIFLHIRGYPLYTQLTRTYTPPIIGPHTNNPRMASSVAAIAEYHHSRCDGKVTRSSVRRPGQSILLVSFVLPPDQGSSITANNFP
jgi:hypothetical protein